MDTKWRVLYFVDSSGTNPAKEFIDSLSRQQKSKVFRILMHIEEYGLQSIIPHVKKLSGTPFWEIRILGKDNIRVIYVMPDQQTVLILHGFIKKKQKTPTKELETAARRYERWKKIVDK
ncbi:MAG: type II toxin-antitoxin system RelE/ParE family toxin [Patescibacteria group bacterium]